ncbi:hypothetical protein EJ02DRAFT_463229 [Clathrospora elynae]|uniref:Uncharacterized protein n=1 Tax=Clathrospora elynae TaxID=706981 RepID=A0A6A5T199_9PLEO|nr:hypothetical protein EJ02DRAFT_463229 [Clathrospora elynae]
MDAADPSVVRHNATEFLIKSLSPLHLIVSAVIEPTQYEMDRIVFPLNNSEQLATFSSPQPPPSDEKTEQTGFSNWKRPYAKGKAAENGDLLADWTLAQGAFKELQEDHKKLREEHQALLDKDKSMEEAYEKQLGEATEKIAALQEDFRKTRDQLSDSRKNHRDTSLLLEKSAEDLAYEKKQRTDSEKQNERLQKDLEHEKAAVAYGVSTLDTLHADIAASDKARQEAIQQREQALSKQREAELELESLRRDLDVSQSRATELEGENEELRNVVRLQEGLEGDIERQREQLLGQERTLLVKDERISQLERQYQKERARNLDAAEAHDAAVAASPTDSPPQPMSNLGESLQAELEAVDDDDYQESFYEPVVELSDVTEVIAWADSPIAPASAPPSTFSIYDAASTTPVAPASAPPSAISIINAASTAPAAPASTPPTAPVAPASAPPSTITIHDAASIVPVAPTPARVSALTVNVEQVASVTPIARQTTTTASTYTQTDAPVLSTAIPQHAASAIAPVEIVIPQFTTVSIQTDTPEPTAAVSTQTDAPELTAISTQTDAPVPTAAVSTQTESLQLTTTVIDTATVGTQTTTSNATISIALVTVTHETQPLDDVPRACSTTSTKTQTAGATETEPAAPILITTSKKTSPSDWFVRLLLPLLGAYCFFLYMELDSWRTANGIGFGNGYSNMAERSGAFGNGRYLFGYIPIAMDIGDSWASEQIARHMSMAITHFENWAGISYAPHY